MTNDKIKVVAPASNPHICYISSELSDRVKLVRVKTKKSLYKLICESAGHSLRIKEDIYAFKGRLKKLGYKTIGEWVEEMIIQMCSSEDFVNIPKPKKKAVNL